MTEDIRESSPKEVDPPRDTDSGNHTPSKREMQSGSLSARVYVAREAVPISGALVRIMGAEEFNLQVMHSVLTDEDGITPSIPLPTPNRSYSLGAGNSETPYAIYDVLIAKDGYYTKRIRSVAVFAGVDAVLPVNMIPYIAFSDGGSYPRGNINATVRENERLEN